MVNNHIREKIIEFKRISGRISYLRLKNCIASISIINAYAPADVVTESKNKYFMKVWKILAIRF